MSLKEVAFKFIAGLPDSVSECLGDVELIIVPDCETASRTIKIEYGNQIKDDVPADCKGLFIGAPAEIDTEESDEEEQVTYDPEGLLILCASNISDEKEAALVLTHEVAHALGLSEEEVNQMGLGPAKDVEEKKEDDNVPPAS